MNPAELAIKNRLISILVILMALVGGWIKRWRIFYC